MSDYNPDWWRRISPHLDQVLELQPEDRPAWLATLRQRDAVLADQLESLLREHSVLARDGFLERELEAVYEPQPV